MSNFFEVLDLGNTSNYTFGFGMLQREPLDSHPASSDGAIQVSLMMNVDPETSSSDASQHIVPHPMREGNWKSSCLMM